MTRFRAFTGHQRSLAESPPLRGIVRVVRVLLVAGAAYEAFSYIGKEPCVVPTGIGISCRLEGGQIIAARRTDLRDASGHPRDCVESRYAERSVRGLATPLIAIPAGSEPIYARLYRAIRQQIMDGRWPAGTKLPSTRLLAADLGIARGTAAVAIDQLVSEGWLTSEARSGVFVAAHHDGEGRLRGPAQMETANSRPICFRAGSAPTDLFPVARWRQHHARIWGQRDATELLMAEATGGHIELREAIARLVCGSRGIAAAANQVIVCASAHSAVEAALRSAVPVDAHILMESPGDPVLAARLHQAGFTIKAVPVDDHGLRTDMLHSFSQAHAIIVSPALQQPSGATLARDRRSVLLDWARNCNALVIELDCEGYLARQGGAQVLPLRAEPGGASVFYVRDFDRVTYPGLNLAFLFVPFSFVSSARAAREQIDRSLPISDQLILADFVTSGGLAGHLRKVTASLLGKRRALLDLLEPFRGRLFVDIRAGGSCMWLTTRPGLTDAVAATLCRAGLLAREANAFLVGDHDLRDEVAVAISTWPMADTDPLRELAVELEGLAG